MSAPRLLCTIQDVRVVQYDDRRVLFTADADIDADGANGQAGGPAAYQVDDRGSEALVNGGMKIRNGAVVGASDWFDDIVILDGRGQPRIFPGGVIASKTAYRWPDMAHDNPAAYVDAETVPYAVVSPRIQNRAAGIVLGCRVKLTHTGTGKSCEAVVADIGPRDKIGEISIAAARAIGIPSSPRNGGTSAYVIRYELWPGISAVVNKVSYPLIAA